jgi:AcrR family transcriptional regulator
MRLLQGAAEVLGQHGLAGATIPRIAKHAGLTPGAVYRRFRNKEVLLETMILQLLSDQDAALRQSITAGMAAEIPFAVLAEQFINGMLVSYRSKAGLLRAVRQFAQDRRVAIGLAVVMTAGALWELVVNSPDRKLWKGLIPDDDPSLKRELTRSFLSYLGVDAKGE